jgi:hypothetical protein
MHSIPLKQKDAVPVPQHYPTLKVINAGHQISVSDPDPAF